MAQRRFVYVSCMGALSRLTPSAWKRFLRDHAAGKGPRLDDYGTFLSSEIHNITDMTPADAREHLNDMAE